MMYYDVSDVFVEPLVEKTVFAVAVNIDKEKLSAFSLEEVIDHSSRPSPCTFLFLLLLLDSKFVYLSVS